MLSKFTLYRLPEVSSHWYHLEDYKFYRVWSFGKIRVGYYMVVFGGRNHHYNHSMWMVR